MNDDLISRAAAIEAAEAAFVRRMFPTAYIRDVPSVQLEIVECKDCQCFEIDKNGVNGFCTKHGIWPDVYDYCSWAERKEDEAEKHL